MPSILKRFGIMFDRRFRDDILVAFNVTAHGMDIPDTFLTAFRRRASRVGGT